MHPRSPPAIAPKPASPAGKAAKHALFSSSKEQTAAKRPRTSLDASKPPSSEESDDEDEPTVARARSASRAQFSPSALGSLSEDEPEDDEALARRLHAELNGLARSKGRRGRRAISP
jgi:hypothetical protein